MAGSDVDPDAMWKPGYLAPEVPAAVPEPVPPIVDVDVEPVVDVDDEEDVEPVAPVEPDAADAAVAPVAPVAPVEPAAAAVPPTSPWSRVEPDDDRGVELFVPSAAPGPVAHDRPHRRRGLVAAGVAVALLAGTGVAAAVVLRDGSDDEGGSDAALPAIADRVRSVWSAVLDGEAPTVVATHGIVAVANRDRQSQVVAYDAGDGNVRWTAHLGRSDALGELLTVDGALIVRTAGRIPTLQSLDPGTGEPRWRRRVRASDEIVRVGDTLVLVGSTGGEVRLEAIDLRTGETSGVVEPDTRIGPAGSVRSQGSAVDVYDTGFRLVNDDVDLDATPIDAVLIGDVVVISVPGELRAVELTGRERWRMPIDPADARYLLQSGGQDGQLLVVSTSATTAIDVRGADPITRWSVEGLPVIDPSEPGLRWVPIRVGAGSGELQILDLEDGSIDASLEVGSDASASALFGRDGAVLVRAGGDGTSRLRAVDYAAGDVRWEASVAGDATLVDGGVVGIDQADAVTTISYVGAG